MREDHLTEAGAMELAWMREDGCGPDIRNVRAMVFRYDQPGPEAHVGLHVDGLGGPSLPVEIARALAALLRKAADEAEGVGKPSDMITVEISRAEYNGPVRANANLRKLLDELLKHDEHKFGPWTSGMKDRVRAALGGVDA